MSAYLIKDVDISLEHSMEPANGGSVILIIDVIHVSVHLVAENIAYYVLHVLLEVSMTTNYNNMSDR